MPMPERVEGGVEMFESFEKSLSSHHVYPWILLAVLTVALGAWVLWG